MAAAPGLAGRGLRAAVPPAVLGSRPASEEAGCRLRGIRGAAAMSGDCSSC